MFEWCSSSQIHDQAAAGLAWACFNITIGVVIGSAFTDNPLLGVAISILVAIGLGLLVDRLIARR